MATISLHPDIASERANQDAQATQLLLENGFDIYAVNFNVNIALLWAASKDYGGDMVQLLLRKGGNVAAKDDNGWTALHFAAASGHEAVVRLLLAEGVDVATKDSLGQTALHFAAESGHEAVVQLLLGKGADVAAKEDDGRWTALHFAAKCGHEAVVRLLLGKGADVAAKDSLFGQTALHLAAGNGHEAVVRLLLEKEADVAAKDDDGRTALRIAGGRRHEAVVRLLLEKGAERDDIVEMGDGQMALQREIMQREINSVVSEVFMDIAQQLSQEKMRKKWCCF